MEAKGKDLHPGQRAREETMTELLFNVRGQLESDPETRAKLDELRTKTGEAAAARTAPTPMMSGPGRFVDPDAAPSPDEKTFLDSLKASGFDVSMKEYKTWQGRGQSEKDWAAKGK